MANNFKIVISATDRSTAVVKKVNDSISKLTRPITDAKRSAVSLGRELSLNPAIKGLKTVGNVANGVAQSLSKVAPAMGSLTSITSIAGLAALAGELTNIGVQWGRMGFEMKNTSNSLGISTQQLQSIRGAAEMAGVSAEEVTSALGGLGKTMFDAKVGNNPPLIGIMDNLKVSFHETADGGFDLIAVMKDVSRAMAAQKNVGAKHAIAQAFGLDGSFSLLSKGPEALDKLQEAFKKLHGISSKESVDQAEEFAKSLNNLSAAAKGVKNSLGENVVPVLKPLVDGMAAGLANRKDTIGKVGGAVASHWDVGLPAPIKAAINVWRALLPSAGARESGGSIAYPNTPGGAGKSIKYNAPELNTYAAAVEKKLGLPSNILNGIKNAGERSDSNAVSPKGAVGVMQFMPDTWKQYGQGDPRDPYASIDAAGRYVKDMLGRYGGDVNAAITEYNGGVKQAQAVRRGGAPWNAETVNYLARVKSSMSETAGNNQGAAAPQNMTITLAGLPSGVTATAKRDDGGNVPVRISRSMQTLEPL